MKRSSRERERERERESKEGEEIYNGEQFEEIF